MLLWAADSGVASSARRNKGGTLVADVYSVQVNGSRGVHGTSIYRPFLVLT